LATSEIIGVLHVGAEDEVPEVATSAEVTHVLAVMVIMVGGVGDEGKDAEGTPLKLVARMVLQTQQYLPKDPIEEGEAMQFISEYDQGKGSRKLNHSKLTKLAKA
jgi:hypothetical protein